MSTIIERLLDARSCACRLPGFLQRVAPARLALPSSPTQSLLRRREQGLNWKMWGSGAARPGSSIWLPALVHFIYVHPAVRQGGFPAPCHLVLDLPWLGSSRWTGCVGPFPLQG